MALDLKLRASRFAVTFGLGLGLALAGGAAGCAAHVVGEGMDDVTDGGRADRGPIDTDAPDGSVDVRYRDVVTYDVFREDACAPDAPPGMRMYECDPLAQTGCAADEACMPWIDYPEGPCGREIYRAQCFPAGMTPVDGFCTNGAECAAGLTCFVTGSGNRCLHLCALDGTGPACPRGAICEPTDLPDFGACD